MLKHQVTGKSPTRPPARKTSIGTVYEISTLNVNNNKSIQLHNTNESLDLTDHESNAGSNAGASPDVALNESPRRRKLSLETGRQRKLSTDQVRQIQSVYPDVSGGNVATLPRNLGARHRNRRQTAADVHSADVEKTPEHVPKTQRSKSMAHLMVDGEQLDGSEGESPRSNTAIKQMVQDLKKENFDLKLRLYMTQTKSEEAESKVNEYEQQLAALLTRLEEQQRQNEQVEQELVDAQEKEKGLVSYQHRLEQECARKDEQIENLSINLSRLSTSMMDVSGTEPTNFSTPIRHAQSMHTNLDSEPSYSGSSGHMTDSSGRGLRPEANSDGLVRRNIYSNTSDDGRIAVVRPTVSETGSRPIQIDVNVDVEQPKQSSPAGSGKKKKKGIGKLLGLCSGKSGQALASQDSVYHKKDGSTRARANAPQPRTASPKVRVTAHAAYSNDNLI